MASRREADGSRLAQYTKEHHLLPVGTPVAVQNQTGRNPTKWDKTGVVIENKPHGQVLVRMDGSRKATLRNRKFVKQIIPPLSKRDTLPQATPTPKPGHKQTAKSPQLTQPVQPQTPILPYNEEQYSLGHADADQHDVVEGIDSSAVGDNFGQSSSTVPSTIVYPPTVRSPTPPGPIVPNIATPSTSPTTTRPRREIKPNSKYDPEIYDLSKAKMRKIAGSRLRHHRRGGEGISK